MERRNFADTVGPDSREFRNTHINIGTGKDISIAELAELVRRTVDFSGRLVFDDTKPDGTLRKLTDVGNFHALGSHHKVELAEGIAMAYEWSRSHVRKNKMIYDTFDNWPIYFNSDSWRRAFAFLTSLSIASEDCARIPLQGDDIYAAIMSYQTCQPDESVLETHDEYIDIQMSIVNSEAIDWFPRHALEVKVPYDLALDQTFYHRPEIAPVRINNYPGFFTVLHPADAHMPKLMTAGKPELVKKVVVKVRRKFVLGQNCAIVQGCV